MMNKSEFLTYLITLYGGFMDSKKQDLWIKDCSSILENDIDFTQFRFHFLHEFDTKTINNIPSPQWLYKESRQFVQKKYTALEETQKYIEEQKKQKEAGVPCPPEIRERMKTMLKNISAITI